MYSYLATYVAIFKIHTLATCMYTFCCLQFEHVVQALGCDKVVNIVILQ